jgi:hypothetical protein
MDGLNSSEPGQRQGSCSACGTEEELSAPLVNAFVFRGHCGIPFFTFVVPARFLLDRSSKAGSNILVSVTVHLLLLFAAMDTR